MGTYFLCPVSIREHECSSCRKHYDPINMFIIHKKNHHPKTERWCYLLLTGFSWVLLQIPDGKVEQVWISTTSPSLLPSSPAEFPVMLVAISNGAHNSWQGWWGVRSGHHVHHPHHKRHLNINQLETKRMGKTKLSLTEQGLFSIKLK